MPKITNSDLKSIGFAREIFTPLATDNTAFDEMLDAVIAEAAAELLGRVGASAYDLAANLASVKKAEKCLAAAELIQRRINIILAKVVGTGGDGMNATYDARIAKDAYLEKAEELIAKLAQGVTADPSSNFACGALVTSHFE